jgi:SAM-dependent methyltransferase
MVNLACGGTFIGSAPWVNLDYAPTHPAVQQADLLRPLPFPSESAALVYSSHFLEHLPRSRVPGFLAECSRVLRPGGVIRVVLPDFEEMCREYLARRGAGDHEKADFVVAEVIDQCVRQAGGGELGELYRSYASDPAAHAGMNEYARERVGEDPALAAQKPAPPPARRRTFKERRHAVALFPRSARSRLREAWFRRAVDRLPAAFREQNVSMAPVGERHHWLWDFDQLKAALEGAGFVQVERCRHDTSRLAEPSVLALDTTDDGRPRKGRESMYVEASKPC